MKTMHRILITALGLILPWLMASGEVKETRQLIQEWVETERILSEEKSKWDSDRAMLLELLASLKAESKALDEQLEKSDAEMAAVSKERADLNERKEQAKRTVKLMKEKIEELEETAKSLLTAFPSPLKDRVSQFSDALQDQERLADLSLLKRLENAVTILQEANRFHHSINLERQRLKIDGKTREFHVLYYGFAAAYFVNESATKAGFGKPGSEGWQWQLDNELADEIRKAVAIRNKKAIASFVELPLPRKKANSKERKE